MDIAEVRTTEGKLYLFVAINRTSKFAVARLYSEATRPSACQFLEELLTNNNIQFGPSNRETETRSFRARAAST